jgi:ABC-type glutathione transport system ATPase component
MGLCRSQSTSTKLDLRLHERVGVQLQQSALPPKIRVGEAVELYASFYRRPGDADHLLGALGLDTKRRSYFRDLSGGQKQRLSIVLALIGQPEIAVLDELTTGLDPEARRETWGLIETVRDSGVTVVLVTHLMEEAERLCDRVALIDHGKVIALGPPTHLGEQAATSKPARLPGIKPVRRGDPGSATRGDRRRASRARSRRHRIGQPRNGGRAGARPRRARGRRRPDRSFNLGGRVLGLDRGIQERRVEKRGHTMITPVAEPRATRWRAYRVLVVTELRLAWRYPVGLVFGVGLPMLLLVILAVSPHFLSRRKSSVASLSSPSTPRRSWCWCFSSSAC